MIDKINEIFKSNNIIFRILNKIDPSKLLETSMLSKKHDIVKIGEDTYRFRYFVNFVGFIEFVDCKAVGVCIFVNNNYLGTFEIKYLK